MNREKITTRIRPLLAGAAFSMLLVSGGMAPPRAPAPRLGADGAAVLAEAGMTQEDIDTLRNEGVLIEGTPT